MLPIHEMLTQLDPPFTGEELFDHLPDIVFFIKNTQGQYLVVNNTLVQRCGARSKEDLIGHTPFEVLRLPLGQSFEDQDKKVLETGQPLVGQLELHFYATRDVGWCLTSKLPLRSKSGEVVGLVGVSQDLRLPDFATEEYSHVIDAIQHAEAHLTDPPSVKRLAEIAKMSSYQLDRRMRRVFGLTTGQWLLKLRIDLAQRLLRTSEEPIASIALEAGYADQSAFTRQFRRATGMSPRDYRNARRTS
ncbi:AraC family transcriptional regulator [Bremerella cremea]|uniref:AraC family transcriptional regulator n=1 Tax=Blastopirellula marina TaxID=124 RepID=A0A2S8F8R8_9BACT|nr:MULTISPECIES: AraC family transcriptional regulator [Pirellulaceae]PQO28547.1 AraC family transcriptional regulator [Blastopirellula marina]RCS41917.1 AraC family transcriptional regulator [Bremerella cremea]